MSESVTLTVTGMTCAACQAHVQRALNEVRGVEKASVNLMTGEATIAYDPAATAPSNLVEAVRDTGYDAELPGANHNSFEEQEARERAQVDEARELGLKALGSLAVGGGAMGFPMTLIHS